MSHPTDAAGEYQSGAEVLFVPQSGADSAGQPWAGRSFTASSFTLDSGEISKELAEAFERFATGHAGQGVVVDALRGQRLLVPLIAEAGETAVDEHGRTVDKTQELSLVTVQGPDGRAVLPAFTSVEAMTRWNRLARPIPVESRRVALAAGAEGTGLVVLDPGSPTEFVLRPTAIRALALDESWTPPWLDEDVVAAFVASIQGIADVVGVDVVSGDPRSTLDGPEVGVVLTLVPGLDQDGVRAAVESVQARWRESAPILEGVESIGVHLRPAG